MSEELTKEHLSVLRTAVDSLDAAATPTKCETFVVCGYEAGRLRDAITALLNTRAAAPEMAEALEGLLDAFAKPLKRRAMGGHDLDQQEAVLTARAALAKARGEG